MIGSESRRPAEPTEAAALFSDVIGNRPELIRSLTVVVPVFNSEAMLPLLVERLGSVLTQLAHTYELILVNDASRDRSWQTVLWLAAKHEWVRGIDLMRNYGQHNAVLCGIRAARYEIVVTMDDDLQHPPEELPRLLAKLAEGFDVVYGAPDELPHGLLRNLASSLTKIVLQGSMGAETARRISAWRVFRTPIRLAFDQFRGPFVSIDVLLTWGTTRFTYVFVRHEIRRTGVSNYTFGKLLAHAFNMITGFSTLPLQVASFVGFGTVAFGLLILVYVVGRAILEGGAPPGFPFLACIVAIFSGAQLFALGMIGEYLARVHFRLMDRPTFMIRQHTDPQDRTTNNRLV